MAYAYKADLWCDTCGEAIRKELLETCTTEEEADDLENETDTDHWPQWVDDDAEADCPNHCASGDDCPGAVKLPSGQLIAPIVSGLTSDGVEYVIEAVREGGEVAEFWREQFDWIDFPPPGPSEEELDAESLAYAEKIAAYEYPAALADCDQITITRREYVASLAAAYADGAEAMREAVC